MPEPESTPIDPMPERYSGPYRPSGAATKHVEKPAASVIQKTPGVVGGEARIRNSRIPVWSLVQLQRLHMSDAEIKTSFEEALSDADLSAAWDYYQNNKQEIDEAIECNEAD